MSAVDWDALRRREREHLRGLGPAYESSLADLDATPDARFRGRFAGEFFYGADGMAVWRKAERFAKESRLKRMLDEEGMSLEGLESWSETHNGATAP